MTYETLFVGLLIAVLYVEVTGLYPGGIIVPAYAALYLDQPLRVLATIVIAFLSIYVYRALSRFIILFGKRRFVMLVFIGAFLAQLWFMLFPKLFTASLELRAVGWIIPGLLANNLEKQKIIPTLASLLTVSIMTYFLVRLLVYFGL